MTSAATSGVSKKVFAATTIALIIVAAIGYGLYYTSVTKATPSRIGVTGGFYSGRVVTFQFFQQFSCAPSLTQLFPNDGNATAASAVTQCEAGKAGTFPSGVEPVWGMSPAFAGLSIFGITTFGATSDGYPTYNGTAVLTDCTGMGSVHQCPDHPPKFYSPAIIAVEEYLNMTSGVMGLPLGVMPFPAHTHIIDTEAGNADIPWNAIAVFVFDPNIFPNPVTGTCSKIVPSSLSNATSNCLTSIAALQAAMSTINSDMPSANKGNPIWLGLGQPKTQVVIAGANSASDYRNANSNIDVPFQVTEGNPFPPYNG
jgi:hypothetical protein